MTIQQPAYKFNGAFSTRPVTQIKGVCLHHEAGQTQDPITVNNYHRDVNGWVGVGYHYLVAKNGAVYQGRPDTAVGAHCPAVNRTHLGICAMGNFETEQMPDVQAFAIAALILDIQKRYTQASEIIRHKDVAATACPGKFYPFDAICSAVKSPEIAKTTLETAINTLQDAGQMTSGDYWLKTAKAGSVNCLDALIIKFADYVKKHP